MRSRLRSSAWGAFIGALALAGTGACSASGGESGGEDGADLAGATNRADPVAGPARGVANVAFYYGGTLPLVGSDKTELARHLGSPAIVVSTPRDDERRTVESIHSIGARAYRYVQFYWSPKDAAYNGIDLAAHPEWAFCRKGNKPAAGKSTVTHGGRSRWLFLDTNESALRERISTILQDYAAQGWDGVMFDRGEAATQYAYDADGRPIWSRASTCTDDPYRQGARFADSFVDILELADRAGLEAAMNTGKSPFDAKVPLRPDPTDPECRSGKWRQCRFLSDAWQYLNVVVNETAGRPKDQSWRRTFVGNRRSEREAARGRRTIGLITTASLGGVRYQDRRSVFYQWSRIKLFNLPVAVNTGDDSCAGAPAGEVCNRYGVYPELVDTVFGRPLTKEPASRECSRRSEVRCVWMRRYELGADLVNVRPAKANDVKVRLGTGGCRYVYDVFGREPLAGNRCVKAVQVDLPAWSGRPLRYSTDPW